MKNDKKVIKNNSSSKNNKKVTKNNSSSKNNKKVIKNNSSSKNNKKVTKNNSSSKNKNNKKIIKNNKPTTVIDNNKNEIIPIKITKLENLDDNIVIKKVKIKKLNKINLLLLIIMLISIITLFVSVFNFIKWIIDNKKIDNQIKNISKVVELSEVKDNDNTEIIKQEEEPDKSNPYWDYIKYNLIDINFDNLVSINPDTKGWIKVNGTNINYPFVQRDNNDFYLNHDFNRKSNGGGWVFLDYRNDITNNDKNTIIYGHGRQNKTIFGTLKDILKDSWLSNTNNHVIKISTKYENTLWQVFSVYRIPTTNDYIQTKFINNEEYIEFLYLIKNRSIHDFKVDINELDRILTLSTCYNNDDKVVLHAKLIKREQKN